MKPLVIELFAGLHGWGEAFAEEGYRVIGFDIVDMVATLGLPRPHPAISLVLQDVLTLHGSQFRDAACIVASPPCQCYSYMAMPWSRSKKLAAEYRDGTRSVAELNALFDACFRIQREAIEASECQRCAGWHITAHCPSCLGTRRRYIPLVVENVKGAQPWVGKARAHFGSYYLWGDVESVGRRIFAGRVGFDVPTLRAEAQKKGRSNFHFFEKTGLPSPSFHGADHEPSVQRYEQIKNSGGSWFAVAHNTESGVGQNPVNGVKQPGHSGRAWFADPDVAGALSSKSPARKAASAVIAKIPFPLAQYIARCFKPLPLANPGGTHA